MNTLAIVLLVAAAALALVLILAARRPDTFDVRRSARIHAPPERIFPLIHDLRAHESWSPFDKPDPSTRKVYSGADTARALCMHGTARARPVPDRSRSSNPRLLPGS